ncbi:MAG: arginase family protein [Chloroflexi bacterium]|nr:arginase family protein [Chloroflexota bacterium]
MKSKYILTPYFLDTPLPSLEALKEWDWIINRETLPDSKVLTRISILHNSLVGYVKEVSLGGYRPVSIAGDCCTAIGMLAGLRQAGINPLLIWFDAHGDFNTWETSPSGFLGGMPLAMLAGLGEQTLLEALNLDPMLQERIILSDGRDLDPGENELIANSLVTHMRNPLDLMDYTFPDQPLWVHFDTDILDPEDVPAQNYLAPGGIHKEELGSVFQYLANTGLITAVSISSWAPDLPGAEQSQNVSMELLDILCR